MWLTFLMNPHRQGKCWILFSGLPCYLFIPMWHLMSFLKSSLSLSFPIYKNGKKLPHKIAVKCTALNIYQVLDSHYLIPVMAFGRTYYYLLFTD